MIDENFNPYLIEMNSNPALLLGFYNLLIFKIQNHNQKLFLRW